jgi:hypothetical protein
MQINTCVVFKICFDSSIIDDCKIKIDLPGLTSGFVYAGINNKK